MGYYSSVHGDISFSPPLTWADLKDYDPGNALFKFDIERELQEAPEGTLEIKTASRIICAYEDEIKAYTVEQDLTKLLELLPDRTFSGEFRIEGEEAGDIRRVFIDRGKVVEWKAELAWPDGSREPGR